MPEGEPLRTVPCVRSGVVLAFDVQGLVSMAQRADCVIEMAPQVGDFVAAGDPLFRVYRGGTSLAADDLRQSVAVGQERTMEQDPLLAFRIIVDVASKGLSPAINDPTTAVLAIDQIHHLLRNVGKRHLDDERVRDTSGRVRLVFRTPEWEDFVQLAVTEIRHFGGESIQVARRLRAMLENLIETLPPKRAACCARSWASSSDRPSGSFPSRKIERWPKSAILREWAARVTPVRTCGEMTRPKPQSDRTRRRSNHAQAHHGHCRVS